MPRWSTKGNEGSCTHVCKPCPTRAQSRACGGARYRLRVEPGRLGTLQGILSPHASLRHGPGCLRRDHRCRRRRHRCRGGRRRFWPRRFLELSHRRRGRCRGPLPLGTPSRRSIACRCRSTPDGRRDGSPLPRLGRLKKGPDHTHQWRRHHGGFRRRPDGAPARCPRDRDGW